MKEKIIHSLSFVEDVIYVIVALLLTASAILLIYNEFISFPEFFKAENQVQTIIEIISKTLLLVMVLEILYTVRITIKEHVLCSEPFLIVGLIAAIRRILIISVETAYFQEKISMYMLEIGVLSGMILVFVVSIVLLKKYK
ncbi:MAG TPA: phosphate-starvation-inducible PsiE family protein [Ignavibacteriaceae bacterium]|nr:phosphate-starvation-inducible PsiE family protein [Ignavibacteriaceae bacterium]